MKYGILSLHAKFPPSKDGGSVKFLGVVNLESAGYVVTEVEFTNGCKIPDSCPYMVVIERSKAFAETRKGRLPILYVEEWEEVSRVTDKIVDYIINNLGRY